MYGNAGKDIDNLTNAVYTRGNIPVESETDYDTFPSFKDSI